MVATTTNSGLGGEKFLNHLHLQSSVGTIAVTWGSQGHLSRLDWYAHQGEPSYRWYALSKGEIPPVLAGLLERLREYFEKGEPMGELPWNAFDRRGWTEFQEKVYRAIAEIPHGETRTYAWVASRVGKKAATRAVGQALKKNPLPILIPCHRVVSSDDLGGFMGSNDPNQPELQLKRRLIELEESYLNPSFSFLHSERRPRSAPALQIVS